MSPRYTSLMGTESYFHLSISFTSVLPFRTVLCHVADIQLVEWKDGRKNGSTGGWESPDVGLTNFLDTAATVDGAIKPQDEIYFPYYDGFILESFFLTIQ